MKRFERIFQQTNGITATTEIWIDNVSGVNYLWHKDANSAGLTPLLDTNGNPVIGNDHIEND